jgi:hypothetical protein
MRTMVLEYLPTKLGHFGVVLEYAHVHLPQNGPVLKVKIPAPWSIWEWE